MSSFRGRLAHWLYRLADRLNGGRSDSMSVSLPRGVGVVNLTVVGSGGGGGGPIRSPGGTVYGGGGWAPREAMPRPEIIGPYCGHEGRQCMRRDNRCAIAGRCTGLDTAC